MEEQQPVQLHNDLNIGNICDGVVVERFDALIDKIVENITDPNTPAEAKRVLTLKFTFKPTADRTDATVVLATELKMPNREPKAGLVFFTRNAKGKSRAFAHNPRQLQLTMEPAPTAKN